MFNNVRLGEVRDREHDPFLVPEKVRPGIQTQLCGAVYIGPDETYKCENTHRDQPFSVKHPLGIANFANSCYIAVSYQLLANIANFQDNIIQVYTNVKSSDSEYAILKHLGELFLASKFRKSVEGF